MSKYFLCRRFWVTLQTLVGSQAVPYIYEDYAHIDDISDGILKLCTMPDEERKKVGDKAKEYALSEFSYQKTIDMWDESLDNILDNWKYDSWSCQTF